MKTCRQLLPFTAGLITVQIGGPTMHGHAPIEGFHPERDAALAVRIHLQ